MTRTELEAARPAELTAEGLAALGAGNACDREPIHLSGAIQAHGLLLVVDPVSYVVTAASENVARLMTRGTSPLGVALAEVIGADGAEAARTAHTTGNPHDGLPVQIQLPGAVQSATSTYDMVAHRRGPGLVLEFEVVDTKDRAGSARFYQRHRDAVKELHDVDGVQAICELTVQRVRELTGYDRVMIYRFERDAHGHVVAEACETGTAPFLGLHYPATDIPRQARALFLHNWIRLIADVDDEPVPIVALPDGIPVDQLDLSMSVFRSVSPMHLQYLRNMDVGASMTISLIVDNELWGLIACHHGTPKRVGHMQRLACEALGQLVSVRLRAAQATEDNEYSVELSRLRAQLIASIADDENLAAGAAAAAEALLGMVAADGALVEIDGTRVSLGVLPDAPELDRLVLRLAARVGATLTALSTDALMADGLVTTVGGTQPSTAATGALYQPLPGRPDGFILWLRGERARTVRWAGQPDPKADTPDAQLGPRASFEEWLEEVRGRSLPWRPPEVAAAAELARAMPAVLLHRTQSQLLRLALHDPLTGLPNRTLMHDRLVELLGERLLRQDGDTLDGDTSNRDRRRSDTSSGHSRRTDSAPSGAGIGLLFIDLDGFKGVNDTRGHLVGDELLVLVARRLTEVVRAQDTVARIGGDEFVVIVPAAQLSDAVALGGRVVEDFRQSFVLGDEVIRSITASVGVTVVPPGTESEEAIRQADSAMYHAKRSGRDQVAVYDPASGRATSQQELAKDQLQLAVQAHDISVDYQPIMRLIPGGEAVCGFEALARWEHATRGRLRAGTFIGLAEENGLIDALGDAVLNDALRQLQAWQDPRLTMAVNVSVRQVVRPGFAAEVLTRLVDLGIDPARLSLEVPQSQLMEQPDVALTGLLEIHATGVRIHIDDFGTGVTSMTYLRDLPATALKIDASLVAALSQGDKDGAVVGAIVQLAHALGMKTIAEGVETAEQLGYLRDVGSDFAQGYLLGEPMPAAAVRLAEWGRGETGTR